MIYSSNVDYAIRAVVLHDGEQRSTKQKSFVLPVDLPIVHSFRCHVNAKNAKEVVCAFASDGYRIQLITLEKNGIHLKEKSRRSLKMYKNLSGLKMDFDENILAISGNLFFYNPSEVAFEDKFMPGVAVYNLSDPSDLISGHISSKRLGFNPTEHNHELRIIKMHNMSLVGVKGHSGAIELYQLKDPEVVFTKINPEEFNNLRLVLTAHKTFHHNLNQFFHLEDQNATAAKHERFDPGNKNKEDAKSDTELDVDTSIPDFNKHKGHKKEHHSHLYIAFVLVIGAGLLYYYFTKRRPELPQRVAYEMTGARETKAQVIDNSMFDKAE